MLKAKLLTIGFVFSATFALSAEAKLYKWVDDQGTTHYGEVMPPKYANKDRDSINQSGMLQKRPEKIDQEAVRAKEEAEQKKKIENQATVERQRRDNTLLDTYSNVNEIDQARDRSLELITARIDSNKMLLKSSDTALDGLKKEVETRTQGGKRIPKSLSRDLAQMEARQSRYAAELAKSEEELNAVRARFELDKELYRKLKGIESK